MLRVLRALYTNTEIMRKKARKRRNRGVGVNIRAKEKLTVMCNSSELTPPFPSPPLLAGSIV